MKISLDPYHSANVSQPQASSCGVRTTASYDRIIRTMISSGELRIGAEEFISEVIVSDFGLSFKIESKL